MTDHDDNYFSNGKLLLIIFFLLSNTYLRKWLWNKLLICELMALVFGYQIPKSNWLLMWGNTKCHQ